jgi:hypothetical protein
MTHKPTQSFTKLPQPSVNLCAAGQIAGPIDSLTFTITKETDRIGKRSRKAVVVGSMVLPRETEREAARLLGGEDGLTILGNPIDLAFSGGKLHCKFDGVILTQRMLGNTIENTETMVGISFCATKTTGWIPIK